LAESTTDSTEGLAHLSDESLIDLIKGGSPEPIDVLFARYRQLVFAISMKILRDVAEAEDVMQDIFLEVWEKAARFDSLRGTVKVWLIQFAYSRSLNRRRDLALRRGGTIATNGSEHHYETEPSYFPDTIEKLTTARQMDRIAEAFEELSQRQRKALELIYFKGLSMREVAHEMCETVDNVRHHYYRGLKRLREVITAVEALDEH
jgi:RNA polymerase sigma-70 factor (ECF subfamily)